MINTLRARLWLTYAILIGGVLVVVAAGVIWFLLNDPSRQETIRLQTTATQLANRLDTDGLPDLAGLAAALELADRRLGYRLIILDSAGALVADSRPGLPQFQSFPAMPRFKQARPLHDLTDASGQNWWCTLRLLADGTILAVARPYADVSARQIWREDLLPSLTISAVVALLLALFLTYVMSRWVSAPLQRIAAAAQRIAAGNYQTIPLEGPDEVRTLAQAFNDMGERVQGSQKSQRDFVANVSHELKTPLTSIQGFAQAILDGTADTPQALQQAASIIYDEAGRMHRMVLELLDLARLDSGIADFKRSPVDVATLVREVVEKFSPQATQARVNLRFEAAALPGLVGDPDRLTQVFTNLIDNALKHTPADGQVVVRARQVESQIEISVADTGPGIPLEDQPRLFERFYQIDKARRGGGGHGVGLGLTIAHEIVQAHRGDIHVQSIPGQGSLFIVLLPVSMPDDSTIARRKKR